MSRFVFTEEILQNIANKYENRKLFKQNDYSAYSSAVKKKLLNKICKHMSDSKKTFEEMTNKELEIFCLKISYISDLIKIEPKLYSEINKRNIFEICVKHMLKERKIIHNKKYTKEEFLMIASKYDSQKDFEKYDYNMYMIGYRNNWLNELGLIKNNICKNWNKKTIQNKAILFNKRSLFYLFERSAYENAIKLNILDEVCLHMDSKTQIKWNFEKVYNDAILCNTKSEFYEKFPNAYDAAKRLNIFHLVTNHMKINNQIKWTKEKCQELTLEYKTRAEFAEAHPNAYDAALKRLKCLDEICSHMKIPDAYNYDRIIYAYIFGETKTIYIGLTLNLEKRKKQRIKNNKDSVTEYINKTNLIPEIIILTDYLPAKTAQKMEDFYINKYKNNNWNLLNKVKGGSLGR